MKYFTYQASGNIMKLNATALSEWTAAIKKCNITAVDQGSDVGRGKNNFYYREIVFGTIATCFHNFALKFTCDYYNTRATISIGWNQTWSKLVT